MAENRRVCTRARRAPSRVRRLRHIHRRSPMSKRGVSPPPGGVLIKRARSGSPAPNTQIAISSSNDERQQALIRTVKRTSSLEAPIISLSGAHGVRSSFVHLFLRLAAHSSQSQGEILSCRFDPSGQNIAACSSDRSVCKSSRSSPTTRRSVFAAKTQPRAPSLSSLAHILS